MNTEQQQVHLIVEEIGAEGSLRGAGATPASGMPAQPVLTIPPGPAWLWPCAGGPPKVAMSRPADPARAVLLEQVAQRRQPRLLLVRAGASRVYINGLPAPHLNLLKEKDSLRLDGEFLLHVTVYNRPVIGPVGAEWIGKECPVCRVPFTASSRCYVCACGAVLHCEDSGNDDCLQCAQLRVRSGCPACQRPVVLEPGYSYLPEGSNEQV
jgi:hypothetical protein